MTLLDHSRPAATEQEAFDAERDPRDRLIDGLMERSMQDHKAIQALSSMLGSALRMLEAKEGR
ncbi:hypothetical protein [Curtobacterium sp. MCBA15_004]|uniref:hypothetical protein n=1 Tax=Curtobacterium sp. MCBA15_004 TaxID=1898733 RepID=UPI00111491C3|nr:hypothetical protein [Curtobacterium sp. MCBA15_004]WIA95772.1 hypothetical protein QOL16_11700 [Curtobacterium sp. MCBA15_004]